jgi:hypothetical protein
MHLTALRIFGGISAAVGLRLADGYGCPGKGCAGYGWPG